MHHLVVVKRGSRLAQASVRRTGIRSAKPHAFAESFAQGADDGCASVGFLTLSAGWALPTYQREPPALMPWVLVCAQRAASDQEAPGVRRCDLPKGRYRRR